MNVIGVLGLTSALTLSSMTQAVDWEQSSSDWEVRPRFATGVLQYEYSQDAAAIFSETSTRGVEGADVKDSLFFAEVGISVFFGNFFADLSVQKSSEGEDDYQQGVYELGEYSSPPEFAGETFALLRTETAESKFERQELSLSIGYALTERLGFFVGYRDQETTFEDDGRREGFQSDDILGTFSVDSTVRRKSEFDQDGFFLGATYVWPFESDGWTNGALSVDLGLAFLDGERRDKLAEDLDEFGPADVLNSKSTGEALGYNLGVAWSGPLSDRLNYSIGVDGYKYDYDGDGDGGNFEDTVLRLTLGISYAIDARGIF